MKSPMLILMEQLLRTEPEDNPKPRRRKMSGSEMNQKRPMILKLQRQLKRARATAATGNAEAAGRAKRLQRALLAVNGKVVG